MKMQMQMQWLGLVFLFAGSAFAQEVINERRDVSSDERIHLEVMRGDVEIIAHDESVFSVEGTLDELAEGFILESENGTTRFEVEMPRRVNSSTWRDQEESELVIMVPRNARVSFGGVNVEVEVSGLEGLTDIGTVNGDVTGENLKGRIELGTVNGDIELAGSEGEIELGTVNGEIEDMNSAGTARYSTVNGEITSQSRARSVHAETVNGEIELDLSEAEEVHVQSVGGEVQLKLANPQVNVKATSVHGEIDVHFASNINAQFEVFTHAGGRIINDLSGDEVTSDRYGPGRSLEFSLGAGAGQVEIDSVNGEIRLRK